MATKGASGRVGTVANPRRRGERPRSHELPVRRAQHVSGECLLREPCAGLHDRAGAVGEWLAKLQRARREQGQRRHELRSARGDTQAAGVDVAEVERTLHRLSADLQRAERLAGLLERATGAAAVPPRTSATLRNVSVFSTTSTAGASPPASQTSPAAMRLGAKQLVRQQAGGEESAVAQALLEQLLVAEELQRAFS